MSTRYHVDITFAAPDGTPMLRSCDLPASANPEDATFDAEQISSAPPICFYDRAVRVYANETTLVAAWSELAVAP